MFDKRLSLITLLFISLLSPGKLPAQTQTKQPALWTTQEAVRYAILNSPDAQAAQFRIESAQADIKLAKAAFYPQLNVAGEYARTNNPMYSFGNILNQGVFTNSIDFNQPGVSDNLQLKALLTYRFYNGGSDQAGLDIAHHRQQAAQLQQQSLHSTLGYTVIRAFFTIVQAEETVQARNSAVASLAASLNVAQARFDEGDLLKEELLNLQVQHSLAQEDLIQTRHGLALAKRGFLNLLGLTKGEPEIDLAGSTFQQIPDTPDFHQRPEIKAMMAIVASFEDGVRKSMAGYYPTADAFGSYQVDKGYELEQGSGNSWFAGVRVNMSLFSGHQTSADVERANAQLAEAKKQLHTMELAYNLEIEEAELGLEQAEKRIQVTAQMVDSAVESARLSRARFKEGLLLSSELINTENRLTDAKVRNALANAEYRIAVADLRRASGLMQYP